MWKTWEKRRIPYRDPPAAAVMRPERRAGELDGIELTPRLQPLPAELDEVRLAAPCCIPGAAEGNRR